MASGDRPGLVLHHPLPPLHSFTLVPLCLGANHGLQPRQQPALPPAPSIPSSQLPFPKQLPASHCSWLRHSHKPLLPALSCSVLPFLPAPKCIALKSLHRAGGGKRAGCRQGTRLPVLATQALAGTALRASSTRWSQRLNEINKAGSQPLLR